MLTSIDADQGKVAIYWDFENFHAVLADQTHGEGAYRENYLRQQPVFFKLDPIIEYAASFGDVIINKAYGNWQWFAKYRDLLNIAGIDLIQIFPRGRNMKNSADIRLALDTLTDIYTHPHLTHVIIVSSDSDFISLAQKIKQTGKFVAGVGVSGFSNRYWIASCNEFKFFESLIQAQPHELAQSPEEPTDTGSGAGGAAPTMEEARDALRRAMLLLIERHGENYVAKSSLKMFVKRLMPSFDERALDCGATFAGFLAQCQDIVEQVDYESGGHVALIDYEKLDQEGVAAPRPNVDTEKVEPPEWPSTNESETE